MSKSDGNVVDPHEVISNVGVDAFRYYLLRESTLTGDSDFSQSELLALYNNELANQLGNLVHRTMSFKWMKEANLPPHSGDFSSAELSILHSLSHTKGIILLNF